MAISTTNLSSLCLLRSPHSQNLLGFTLKVSVNNALLSVLRTGKTTRSESIVKALPFCIYCMYSEVESVDMYYF